MVIIDERIHALNTQKEQLHKEYLSANNEQQSVIATASVNISIELKFLNKLKTTIFSCQTEQLIDFMEYVQKHQAIYFINKTELATEYLESI